MGRKRSVEKVIDEAIAKVGGLDPEVARYAAERAGIEAVMADPKQKHKLLNWPPSRGPMPKRLRRKPKVVPGRVKIEMLAEGVPPLVTRKDPCMELHCDVHIDTVATLTLEQADRVLHLADDDGDCHSIILSKTDLVLRKSAPPACAEYKPSVIKRKRRQKPPTLVVDIRYPVSRVARVTISPFRWNIVNQSWGHVLWSIARAYRQIYKEWKKYGVWGHASEDLWCEGLGVTPDGRLVLHVGS